jgi:preprotein translocase subunit SecG
MSFIIELIMLISFAPIMSKPTHILITFIFKTCLIMVTFGSTEEEQEKRMGIDPADREPAEAIAAEFEGSTEAHALEGADPGRQMS